MSITCCAQSGNRCERDDFLDVHGPPSSRGVAPATRSNVDRRTRPGADHELVRVSQDRPVGPQRLDCLHEALPKQRFQVAVDIQWRIPELGALALGCGDNGRLI